jgi:hypothetical protein
MTEQEIEQLNPKDGLVGYAQQIADAYEQAGSFEEAEITITAEELLLKISSQTPETEDVYRLILYLKYKNITMKAVKKGSDFEMLFLLKSKVHTS